MTPLFPAQRAAEEFDRVLSGRATQDVAERYADLVATVQVLHEQPAPAPRAEFTADLRARLMTAAETELVAAPVVRRITTAPSRSRRRLGAAAAALVIVGGSAGMAAAASGALPGQPLYPIKLGTEQVANATRFGQAAQGAALLGDASTRLDEVSALLAQPGTSPALVTSTLSAFQSSAGTGADKLFRAYQGDASSTDIATVRSFTASTMDQLAALAGSHDPSITSALSDAADTLAEIDQQARTLCASCSGGEAIAPPYALASASGAASVDNLLARPTSQAVADLAALRAAAQAHAAAVRARAEESALQGLSAAAQGAANHLGSTSSGGSGSAGAPLGGSGAGLSGLGTQLRSTVTSTGQLVPSITAAGGSAVSGLVDGVTGSLGAAAGGGAAGQAVSGLGKALTKATTGVTGTLGGITQGLNP